MARILWSIHLYLPDHACGSEMMAHQINKYFISKGHQVRIILHYYNGQPYTWEGVEIFPGTGLLDAYRWADVICTHLDITQSTMMYAMAVGKPLIHFIHNDISYQCIKNGVKGQYVVYNSNWIGNRLKYKWPSIVFHPPCDTTHYNVNSNPIENGAITLISLNERKGGYMLAKIAQAMPDRKFIGVVGSYDNPGPLKLTQGQIIAMMPDNVEIVENSPDIRDVYRRTRLLIMPSDYESWGRTATEAMCNGIPVICTPTDGLRENCGYAGFFVGTPIKDPEPGEASVKTGTVQDWVSAIRYFDDRENYQKYSLLCRNRAAELDPVKELEALEKFILQARF